MMAGQTRLPYFSDGSGNISAAVSRNLYFWIFALPVMGNSFSAVT
jgi:hypothetical protein